jgi:hypothetical protein
VILFMLVLPRMKKKRKGGRGEKMVRKIGYGKRRMILHSGMFGPKVEI